jgi:hypothetical protein
VEEPARFAFYHSRDFLLIACWNFAYSWTDSFACPQGKRLCPEDLRMKQWSTNPPDLFAPPPQKIALTPEQRTALRKLLEVLLREAVHASHCSGAEDSREVGHDKHHA